MVEMYVKMILQGRRFFEEVPKEIKDEVKKVLIQIGREDLLEV